MKRAIRPRRAIARASGFTLIEMLVAIALLAVIAALAWRGLDATVRGRDDVTSNLAETRLLGRYFSQLQFDMINLVTPDEVFGPPLRIRRDELVLIRHLAIGNSPTQVQVVRYQLKGHQLMRSASQPLSSLSQLADALHHMDDFASVVASDRVRGMTLAVWVPQVGWTGDQKVLDSTYARFLDKHGISNSTSVGLPLPRGIRFTVTMGASPVEFVRTLPIGQ
jgi:general secretion pathway protein J